MSSGHPAGATASDGLQAACPPKQVSAAELREYLHLPAKEVAKELGMCLTSLKKVCRQHGIVRWPYRRLKMIDRKIQSLQSNMAEGTQDRQAIEEELAKLQNERSCLPNNYGSCAMWEDDDGAPSSPLSCASTTAAFSDDAVDSEGDANGKTDVAEMMHSGCQVLELRGQELVERPSMEKSGTARFPIEDDAGGKVGTRQGATRGGVGEVGGGSVQVELELPPEAAAHIANGAQLVVHQENGMTQIQIIPSDAVQPHIVIPVPGGGIRGSVEARRAMSLPTGAAHGGTTVAKRAAKRKLATVMTDEEMIASLAGCASSPSTPCALAPGAQVVARGTRAAMSDLDLVAALAADAIQSSQLASGVGEEMSDEELAAALAGCAGEGGEDLKHACAFGSSDMEAWNHTATCYEHDVAHDATHDSGDGALEMALFEDTD